MKEVDVMERTPGSLASRIAALAGQSWQVLSVTGQSAVVAFTGTLNDGFAANYFIQRGPRADVDLTPPTTSVVLGEEVDTSGEIVARQTLVDGGYGPPIAKEIVWMRVGSDEVIQIVASATGSLISDVAQTLAVLLDELQENLR